MHFVDSRGFRIPLKIAIRLNGKKMTASNGSSKMALKLSCVATDGKDGNLNKRASFLPLPFPLIVLQEQFVYE